MTAAKAVIFDLGGTLMEPDLEAGAEAFWGRSFDHLAVNLKESAGSLRFGREAFVGAMLEAEEEHWRRVNEKHWSGPPGELVEDGLCRLGMPAPREKEILAALAGCAQAVTGWAEPFVDARDTLWQLRKLGYRLGLLSNTWWDSRWCNEDLKAHDLAEPFDEAVFTSELDYSKPHTSVFLEITSRLGVEPEQCAMVGDRMRDDVQGAQGVGMCAVWVRNDNPWPRPEGVVPEATIDHLGQLPQVLRSWRKR